MKKLYLTAFVVTIASFLQAYAICVIAGALGLIRSEFQLSPPQEGLVAGIILIGALLGSAVGGPLADSWGRKKALIATALLYAISSILILPVGTFAHLVCLRFAIGLAVGMTSILVPLYLAEVAPTSQRGVFVTFFQLSQTIGTLVAYFVNYSASNWRVMLTLACLPALFQLCVLPFLPESPAWKKESTRGDQGNQGNKGGSHHWKEILSPVYRFALFLGLGIAMVQQFAGINAVIIYAPKMFEQAGVENAMIPTMILGGVSFLFTLGSAFLVDRSGRRKLYLLSLLGVVVSLLLMMITLTYAPLLSLFACIIYLGWFSLGLGPVTWVIISEIYPLSIRAKTISLMTLFNWGAASIAVFVFPILLSTWGVWAWGCFALIIACAFPFFYRFIPETKNKTLDQISRFLSPRKK